MKVMLRKINRITGIYLGKGAVDAVSLSRVRGEGWVIDEDAPVPEDSSAQPAEQVRFFLSKFKPDKGRRIVLAVPRSRVFFREIEFPQLTSEEALSAVRMGVDLHAHLKQEDIYFDVYELTTQDSPADQEPESAHRVRMLLAYVERAFLDPVLEAVHETGHSRSLGCVSPVSCGIDGLLRYGGRDLFPCTVLSRQDDEIVISLHSSLGWEGSHSVSLFSQAGITHRLEDMARLYPEPFHSLIKSPVFRAGEFHLPETAREPADPCAILEPLSSICSGTGLSMGLCAAGIGLKSYPEISFQDTPRKKPFRIRINAFQLIAMGAAAIMLVSTGIGITEMIRLSSQVGAVESRLEQLEKRMKPLIAVRSKIDEIDAREKELTDFGSELPALLDVLRDLAVLTPGDTWIRNFSLSNGKFRISAQGKSATACVASLRKSRLFSQVKLVSSVTKTKDNTERFSLEIIPKHVRRKSSGAGR